MTNNELLLLCGLGWAAAVVVFIALDYLGSNWPKRRFRARGWLLPRQITKRVGFRRKVRAVKDEQIRATLESALGTPTLALSAKRRSAVIDRAPTIVTDQAIIDASSVTIADLEGDDFENDAFENDDLESDGLGSDQSDNTEA